MDEVQILDFGGISILYQLEMRLKCHTYDLFDFLF